MAANLRLSVEARNIQLDALAPLANDGYFRIYDGTQPADPDTAVSTQQLLAELRFGSTAFGASSNGTITANAIIPDTSANNTGTATWFRILKSNGTSALWDGSIGTSSANVVMNSTAIQQNSRVEISAFTHSLPMQGA
jgi:hypothetical protein